MRSAIWLVALAVFGTPVGASACRCANISIATGYSRAYSVVVASVEVVRMVEPAFVGSGSIAHIKILGSWKHGMPLYVDVSSQTTCAFDWNERHTYVLALLRESDGRLSTSQCLGNSELPARAAIAWLEHNGQAAPVEAQ